MQNFVSKWLQNLNSPGKATPNEGKHLQIPYMGDSEVASNVIGVLPPRCAGGGKAQVRKRDSKTISHILDSSQYPESPGDGMVSSQPTLSPCHSYPPSVIKTQLKQLSTKSNSDQNLSPQEMTAAVITNHGMGNFYQSCKPGGRQSNQEMLISKSGSHLPDKTTTTQPSDKKVKFHWN